MLQKVQKTLNELNMIASGDVILVGLSGGADSVALLLVLKELSEQKGFSLEAIHVEHGIRGEESKADEAFAKALCEENYVPFQSVKVDVPALCRETGLGVEEAARKLRYEVFEKAALEKGAKIALAHHQEDNAETILFQLTRGSSLPGLCGMQSVREDENGVYYIRPLLGVHRAEIEAFLKERGQAYCIDSTNAELEYSRNFLRNQVIPELAQINGQAVEHINQAAAHLSEIKDYLDMEAERVWQQVAEAGEHITLDAKGVQELHPVMQKQIAYKAIILTAGKKKDITSAHVEDLLDLCRGQSGKRIFLPYGITAWKEFAGVHVAVLQDAFFEETVADEVYEVSSDMLEESLREGKEISVSLGQDGSAISCRIFEQENESLEIPRKTYTKWLNYDKIKQGFCIRTRRSGDYFISDASGHHKKLKSYFIDEKIPQAKRNAMWLLAQGNEVLWLVGGRISEHVKVSQETKYILEITYDGGKRDE